VDLASLLPPVNRSPVDYRRAAEHPDLDAAGLSELAASPYPFVRLAVARHVRTPPATLTALLDSELSSWDRNHLLQVVSAHPGADHATLLAVLERVAALLAAGERPYAAVLTLAGRTELAPDEVRPLTNLPGTTRRLRARLLTVIAARPDSAG
jgi:sirohydrochlorin ferrochelatase